MKRLSVGILVAVCGVVAYAPGVAVAAPGPGGDETRLVSLSTRGVQGNQDSELPALSADGRFVAFVSLADNLVPGDTNESADVFVTDLRNGHTERVSTGVFGRQGDGHSGLLDGMGGPAISADGRYVAFDSEATNLVFGDTNGTADVFVRDRRTGRTTRVSVGAGGRQGNGASTQAAISADGQRVAFSSFADDLVAPDTNFGSDIFVRDRASARTVRASDAPDGTQADNLCFEPALNGTGHLVVFTSFAHNLGGNLSALDQVFLRDLDTGRVDPVSSPPTSTDPLAGSEHGRITPDGRFVVFDSQTTDLFPDANGHVRDAVLLDRATGRYEQISRDGNDNSTTPVLSADGRFVAYASAASTLVPGDTNNRLDVFVRDRRTGTTRLVSTSTTGAAGDLDSDTPTIDAAGDVLAYASTATTLAPETDQGFFASDIFVRDRR